jgi:amino acid transporter
LRWHSSPSGVDVANNRRFSATGGQDLCNIGATACSTDYSVFCNLLSPLVLSADFAELINMVSISTLFAFWIVALALLWYRCLPKTRGSVMSLFLLSIELFVMVAACIGESLASARVLKLRPFATVTRRSETCITFCSYGRLKL